MSKLSNININIQRHVFPALKDADDYDNTFKIFTSDHGELGGAHCLASKQYSYEESIGIPLLISRPGSSSGQINTPASTEDLFPTILGLAGIPHRDKIHGSDLSALTFKKFNHI